MCKEHLSPPTAPIQTSVKTPEIVLPDVQVSWPRLLRGGDLEGEGGVTDRWLCAVVGTEV